MHPAFFDFSFNSLYGIHISFKKIEIEEEILSIPFMGFGEIWYVSYWYNRRSFNSLYGIHNLEKGWCVDDDINFQFPLWDSETANLGYRTPLYHFQFPLWDSP